MADTSSKVGSWDPSAAAVVLDDYHYPVAGMTVIGPVFRLEESQLESMGTCCVKAAQQVHEQLIK